ncbi:MAG: hypothetical protein P1P74_11590 [Desulfuromonadales bacterium]|nr:hypothetical protein [Desulfuromonadales bacterium]
MDGATRYLSTESNIATLSVNPTLAWQLTPSLSLEGEGDGWVYNFGLLLKKEKWSLALAYRSAVDVRVKGEAEISGIAPALQPAFGGSDLIAPLIGGCLVSSIRFTLTLTMGLLFNPCWMTTKSVRVCLEQIERGREK